jgi:hypothetical protein
VAIAASPDGSRVIVTGRQTTASRHVRIVTTSYDATTGARQWRAFLAAQAKQSSFAEALAISPDSSKVFVTGSAGVGNGAAPEQYVTAGYAAATGAKAWSADITGLSSAQTAPLSVAVSADSSQVFVTGASWQNEVWGPGEYLTVAYQS